MTSFRAFSYGAEAYIMLGRREIHVFKARGRNTIDVAERDYIAASVKATPRDEARFREALRRFRAEAERWEASS